MPSFLSSKTHCFCFIRAAIAHVKQKNYLGEKVKDSSSDDESNEDSNEIDLDEKGNTLPE
jgi:hypothetical protein